MPGEPGLDGTGDGVGPHLAGGELQARCRRASKPRVAIRRAVPSKPLSPMSRLLPPPMISSGVPAVVGLAHGGDDLGVGGGRDQTVGRAAEAEGGQGGEGGVVEFLHGASVRVARSGRGSAARAARRP